MHQLSLSHPHYAASGFADSELVVGRVVSETDSGSAEVVVVRPYSDVDVGRSDSDVVAVRTEAENQLGSADSEVVVGTADSEKELGSDVAAARTYYDGEEVFDQADQDSDSVGSAASVMAGLSFFAK